MKVKMTLPSTIKLEDCPADNWYLGIGEDIYYKTESNAFSICNGRLIQIHSSCDIDIVHVIEEMEIKVTKSRGV